MSVVGLPDVEVVTDATDPRFVHVRGCAHPKVPRDVRRLLAEPPTSAEFLDDVGEWRVPARALEWGFLEDLRREGWTWRTRERHQPTVAGTPECGECGQPYRRGTRRGECTSCGEPLHLVEPHTCDEDCHRPSAGPNNDDGYEVGR